ncbi:MAG: hypothetical protein ACOX4G_03080 [Limnochordia bacterium]|jgi:hypothetical protein
MSRTARGILALCLLALLCFTGQALATLPEYGAEANPTGEPLGGGTGYTRLVHGGEYEVQDREGFLAALKRARPGEIIYLLPQAEIDLTGLENVEMPQGVTIAGNRGDAGSPGPLIYSTQLKTYPLFNVGGPGVRVTGIRLRGPSPQTPDSIAMRIMANDVEVDNCEIFNWSYAGVAILRAQNAYIHHNFIHDVRRPGLGYPVVVDDGTALVEANIFDYYRHAIAATGTKGTGYEARYNLVRESAISHAFDMHGGTDYCPRRTTCTDQDVLTAGAYVDIHHNTFLITSYEAIRIRGVPSEYVDIHHNWFIDPNPTRSVRYRYYSGGNAHVYDNLYGPDQRHVAVLVTPSPFIFAEGSRAIVGLAGGKRISYGFANPSATSTTVARGSMPVELLPVVVDASLGMDVEVTGVAIRLGGVVIYEDDGLPAPGELVVDTMQMPDGVYEMALEVETNLGFPLRQSVRFHVDNWWQMTDNIDAPALSGWFGVLDFSRTSAVSDGWTYATDNPEDFWQDGDRRVRLGLTEEFLIWETPRLQHFRTVLYSRSVAPDGVGASVSDDQTTWSDCVCQVKATGPNEAGWYRLELDGWVPHGVSADWFRLVLRGGANPADTQIGEVEFRGLH